MNHSGKGLFIIAMAVVLLLSIALLSVEAKISRAAKSDYYFTNAYVYANTVDGKIMLIDNNNKLWTVEDLGFDNQVILLEVNPMRTKSNDNDVIARIWVLANNGSLVPRTPAPEVLDDVA